MGAERARWAIELLEAEVVKGRPLLPLRLSYGLLLAALFICYFGSLWIGARNFPHSYDWRRNVISNLLSPRDNPGWYRVPSAGVALAGLCMLPLAAWLEREIKGADRPLSAWVRRTAFLAGIGCLILSAIVVPQHVRTVLGVRHAHEMLARTSAAALGLGMLAASRSVRMACRTGGGPHGRLRALGLAWWLITLLPIAGALCCGAMVALGRLRGAGAWPAEMLRGTAFWHLAFWEWIGSAAVFLFFALGIGFLGAGEVSAGSPKAGTAQGNGAAPAGRGGVD